MLIGSQEWNDVNLRWNSSEYGGVKDLRIPPHRIWKPDVLMYNRYVRKNSNLILWLKTGRCIFRLTRYNIRVWYVKENIWKLLLHTMYFSRWKIIFWYKNNVSSDTCIIYPLCIYFPESFIKIILDNFELYETLQSLLYSSVDWLIFVTFLSMESLEPQI
jgi:hypothetical protein